MASEPVDPATVGVDAAPAAGEAETEALTPAAWLGRGRRGPEGEVEGRPAGDAAAAAAPRFLGRYLILHELGRGGMGVVFTAYDPELDRKVALKVLRPDPLFDERQAARQVRLQREAQALARLSHPNVIQVYDVGTVGDQVFLAMELVKGENLGSWLEAEPRSWQEVVACFVAAGEGLAAAHAAGIVHRDFKPGNVLVGRDGRVRVLDFGIARPVERGRALESDPDHDLDAATVLLNTAHPPSEAVSGQLTRLGQVLGTPRYIAPELIFGRPPDARSDQFAFGVALFEALYGVSPFAGEDVTQLAFAAVDGRLAGEPAGRRVPSWLRRVVIRTLAGDPAARYPDMATLLADLRRDRAAERRRRLLLAAVPLALLVAVGTWRLGLAQREAVCGGGRARLADVWDAARRTAVETAFAASRQPYAVAAWHRVAATLDAYGDAWVAMHRETCEATRVRGEQSEELLDRRMQCLDRRRVELAAFTGSLATADDALVERAPQAASALSTLDECANAAALLAPVAAPSDGVTADRVTALRSTLATIRAQWVIAQYEPAAAAVGAARDEARRLGYAPLVAEAERLASAIDESRGDWPAAEREAFAAAAAAISGRHDLLLAEAYTDLVWLVGFRNSRAAEGERWAELARAQIGRAGGSEELLADLDSHLTMVYTTAGDARRGLAAGEAALERYSRILPADHPTLGRTLNRIGTAYVELHDPQHARESFERALEQSLRSLGPDHPTIAIRLGNLALVQQDEGNLAGAIETQRRAMAIEAKTVGTEHPQYALSLCNLGSFLEAAGRYEEALAADRQCAAVQVKALGPATAELGPTWLNTATVLRHLRRLPEALAMIDQALVNLRASHPEEHPWVLSAVGGEALILRDLGRRAEAEERLRQSLARAEAAGVPAVDLDDNRRLLADLLWESGRHDEARRLIADSRRAMIAGGAPTDAPQLAANQAWISKHP